MDITAPFGRGSVFILLAASSCAGAPRVTFERDVMPILQKHCQTCHRPGEIGPMSLMTYEQARPWAKAIRESVVMRRMPPWHADPRHGEFTNDRSLTEAEIQTVSAWVDRGAPQGSSKDAPPPRKFASAWQIGHPDVIFELPQEFHVPATGTVPYQWITSPTRFTEDKWVQAVEVRPGNPSVVHHAVIYSRDPDSQYARDYPHGEFFDLIPKLAGTPRPAHRTMLNPLNEPNHLQAWAPGANPVIFAPGQARLIKSGSDILWQLHYTTTGKPQSDRTHIGLIFAKEPVKERVKNLAVVNRAPFSIPQGEADFRLQSRVETIQPLRVVGMMPHMHLRGKSMEYRAIYPDGSSEVLLRVPKFRFHWQTTYYLAKPRLLPVGTILTCEAAWDNSTNNPDNPDPSVTVRSGLQSWDEMMSCHMDIGFDPGIKDLDFFRDAAPLPLAVAR